jgi:group I intron endonuclease
MIENTINHKVYVGFTTSSLKTRFRQHARCGNINTKIGKAIQKYGVGSFKMTVLFQSDDIEYTLNTAEGQYIELFNSREDGYNMTDGGDGRLNYDMPSEVKKKISAAKMGVPGHCTEDRKQKLRSYTRDKRYNYDDTVYNFIHKDTNQTYTGTKLDFCEAYGLSVSNVYKLIKGFSKSIKRWTINV